MASNEEALEELPRDWSIQPLRSLLRAFESGSRPKGGVRGIASGIPSIGGEHLDRLGGFRWGSVRFVPDDFYRRMRRGHIKPADILIVKDGATTGKVSLVRSDFPFAEAAVNEHVFICRPDDIVAPEYLFWFLFSPRGQSAILDNFQGSAQGGINQSFADNVAIPFPRVHEQRRISRRLDHLLSRTGATRERLDNVPSILRQFRKSVLAAAVTGQLTQDWREHNSSSDTAGRLIDLLTEDRRDRLAHAARPNNKALPLDDGMPEIPHTWTWTRLDELVKPERVVTYGVIKLGSAVAEGVPTLRSSDVRHLFIDEANVKRISPTISPEYGRTILSGGEVVVTVRGSLGGVAVVPPHMAGFNVSREVAVVAFEQRVSADYLCYAMASPWNQAWLMENTTGAVYTGVNIEDLRQLPIPLPPADEQPQIVSRIRELLSLADAVETRCESARARSDRLSNAILARAFRGEL